jgi:hypothetical protein
MRLPTHANARIPPRSRFQHAYPCDTRILLVCHRFGFTTRISPVIHFQCSRLTLAYFHHESPTLFKVVEGKSTRSTPMGEEAVGGELGGSEASSGGSSAWSSSRMEVVPEVPPAGAPIRGEVSQRFHRRLLWVAARSSSHFPCQLLWAPVRWSPLYPHRRRLMPTDWPCQCPFLC